MIGDHIRTLRDGRWTHAIDCGDETVLVLADDAAPPPRVRRSYRPEFVAGAEAVEVVRHRERTFPADEIVARAYSRVADPALAAMFRDSEAFAEWCTTGRLPAAAPNTAISVPGAATRPAAPAGGAVPSRRVNGATPTAKRTRGGAAPKKARAARAARAARKAKPARAARKAKAAPRAKAKAKAKAKPNAKRGARRR